MTSVFENLNTKRNTHASDLTKMQSKQPPVGFIAIWCDLLHFPSALGNTQHRMSRHWTLAEWGGRAWGATEDCEWETLGQSDNNKWWWSLHHILTHTHTHKQLWTDIFQRFNFQILKPPRPVPPCLNITFHCAVEMKKDHHILDILFAWLDIVYCLLLLLRSQSHKNPLQSSESNSA